ncbi:MAG: D-glycero-beta-D-manno-heptose-7-phosphate kinase [Deltaproteobacteria bacterium]|nr:D-glycero-beta-D-manno-heptose-7-phosphate kinase [Deltaproteobacteria bacterium]
MMDEYIWGDVSRISPEAPVPVITVTRERYQLGGAANVVRNIRALGGRVLAAGVVGRDAMGEKVWSLLRELDVRTEGILVEPGRPTTMKTRVIAHNQQVVRYDRESREPISDAATRGLLRYAADHLAEIDAILVSDYAKGVVSKALMDGFHRLIRGRDLVIAVDPKLRNFAHYRYLTAITPNHHEAAQALGMEILSEADLCRAGRRLLRRTRSRSVLITRGGAGMSLFEEDGAITHIPAVAREVYDVTGAGDTVIGAFTLALAAGADFKQAARLSNIAAGIVVGEVGTATVTVEKLKGPLNNGIKKRKSRPGRL